MNIFFKRMITVMLAALMLTGSCALTAYADETPIASAGIAAPIAPAGDAPPTEPSGAAEPTELAEPTEPAEEASLALRFANTAEGTAITWNAVEGAERYVLLLCAEDGDETLAETADTAFTHAPLEDGATCRYTVRALDHDASVIVESAAENRFLAPPVIESIKATTEGVTLSWKPQATELYRVYRREQGKGWKKLADTAELTYHDTSALSGTHYTYTVRCVSYDGERFLSYHNGGRDIHFIRIPTITSIENTAAGARVKWEKPAGVDRMRLYYKGSDGWVRLTETTATSFVHDPLANGKSYTYTVRAVDGKGNFISDFSREGWENTFIAPPVITSLTSAEKGVMIRWNACPGAEKYRIYYKDKNGSWKRMVETEDNFFLDTDVRSGNHYTYTVRCISADGERFLSYHNSGKRLLYVGLPTISAITNTADGAYLSWQMPKGADRVRVYYKGSDGWVRLSETTAKSFTHQNPVSGKETVYTIRAVDSKGNFLSDFSREGWANTFVKAPVISSFRNTEKGVEIRWDKCEGAERYRVYYKGRDGSWKRLAETNDTVLLDTDVRSGGSYTYTVRCITADGSDFMSGHTAGKKTRYIAAPTITSFSNTETGIKVSWTKPEGSERYRLYVRTSDGWERLTETTGTSYTHDKRTNHTSYTYTVRCVDSKGNFLSDFNHDGWTQTFIEPPRVSSVSRSGSSNLVKWNAVEGASAYRVYRKSFGGSFGRITDAVAETSYQDTAAKADTLYAYTVRCLDASGEVVSDYYGSDTYYYNGALASGNITVGGNTLYFEKGHIRKGYQTVNGKTYYYNASGVIQKNGVVGSDSEGYRYADKNGVISSTYCNGVTSGGVDWNVINGKATRVKSDSDRTLFRALKLVYKVTDQNMSKAKKLRACFDYLQKASIVERNPRIPDYTGMDWPIIYANDIFVHNEGNCLSFAAAFAYMAKGIGYTEVYGCHSGGHGWAEIDGKVYDPEWGMHHSNYSYFGMTYSEPCDVPYARGIAPGAPWMHIKI